LTKRALCRVPDSREILGAKLDMKIAGDRPDVLGYAIVRGVTIEILDVSYFLEGSGRFGVGAYDRRSLLSAIPYEGGGHFQLIGATTE
jgi:hypothetical protein